MAYIGKAPVNGYHAKQTLTGDGSTVTFSLDQTVASETSIIVSVGGVIQEPKTAYDLVTAGTQITFTAAPASTDRVYIQFLGTAVVQNVLDANGAQFYLDVDGDTSLTADTDDEIDIRVGGTDRSTIKATGFHNIDSIKFVAGTGDDMQMYHDGTNSYLTNATGALKIATETSGIALTIGHTTSEVTVADNMTVTGNLTIGGTTNFGDFDISNVGSIALDTITNDGTDITLDSSGDIVLDAAGNDIFLKDAGTTYGSLTATGSNLIIKSGTTTAATFSGANVTLAGTVGSGNITSTGTVQGTTITATTAFVPDASDGAALGTTALEFSDLFLADGAVINFGDDQDITLTHTADTGLVTNGTFSATTITATTAFVPDASDGAALGTTALEFSDLYLADGAVIGLGDDQEVTLTHVADTGLTLNSTNKLMFNDASQFIQGASATVLDIAATDEIELTATLIDVVGNFTNSGTIVSAGVITAPSLVLGSTAVTTTPAELNLIDGGTSRGTTAVASGDGILINDGGTMAMTNVDTVSTYFASHSVGGGNIVTTGALDSGSITSGFGAIDNGTSNIRSATITAETAFVPDASGGADLGTTALEFNDAFFNDAAVINFGDDQDVTLTHVEDTGLLLNSTMKIQFNDASQFIHGSSATVLSIGATNEIDLTATAIDINGTCDISGTFSLAGTNVTATAAEVNYSDLATLGTSAASKVLSADSNNLTKITGGVYIEEATLSFDATQDWDVRASPVAKVTLTANVTFDAPTNPTTGQYISIVCIQDAGGTNTIAWNAVFEFTGDTAPTATATGAKGDLFTFRYNGAKWLEVGRNLNLTLS